MLENQKRICSKLRGMGTFQFEHLCRQMAHPAGHALALEPMGVQENIIKQKLPTKFTILMNVPLLQI